MSDPLSTFPDTDDRDMIEGFARVVAISDGKAWAEPEQAPSCGGCHSAGLCSIGKQIGDPTARQMAKRFALPGDLGLTVGEKVVVGVREDTLTKGALTAYGLPLVTLLAGGILGQELGRSDALAALGAVIGMVAGLFGSRIIAGILSARGELTPRFLRRTFDVPADGACHTELGHTELG
ncbi:Sigma factor RpoE regulatory protein RseC [Paramagnetospirillum magnetotacticum MS-1]|uniref:Sigma factor RpoE regulatory protein RseC n=1 Tax=Paramagnetospirillum magnetotacticum MS-1 TaxID=272627 RepID=A0A0C2YH55_PARME|nr:SoxR reducing system RseC family protein [Paramagnetospirillum magnetotacticum]KIL99049.1 Sigma factor RpoE regulatory protein RseC [Paramagnetospirillum magnetotacticum MS-1]